MNQEPMATVSCVYCNTTLSYPQNSLYIQCPKCSNTMNPATPHASYVNCIGCNTLLSHPPTSLTIQCPKCLMVMDLPARGMPGMGAGGIGGMDPNAGRKSRKKRKDPNAPKRATNAYMVFCKERRAALKEERPDLQFGKLGARLGEMWRLMTPEEKKPYESRANGDRDRYKTEMGSYQSANMLKGNAMSQLGLPDDVYAQHQKKLKLEDGSVGVGQIDYSQLDPAQLELLQQQQQQMYLQQSQLAAAMQQQQVAQQVQQQVSGVVDPSQLQQVQQQVQQQAALQQQQQQAYDNAAVNSAAAGKKDDAGEQGSSDGQ